MSDINPILQTLLKEEEFKLRRIDYGLHIELHSPGTGITGTSIRMDQLPQLSTHMAYCVQSMRQMAGGRAR